MIVVLDTNVVVSAFLSVRGSPARVLELWQERFFDVAVSETILEEYRRALGYERARKRYGLDSHRIDRVVEGFRRSAILVEPRDRLAVIEHDEQDNRFLECAIASGAGFLVSGDAHLRALGDFSGIPILSPSEFLAVIGGGVSERNVGRAKGSLRIQDALRTQWSGGRQRTSATTQDYEAEFFRASRHNASPC